MEEREGQLKGKEERNRGKGGIVLNNIIIQMTRSLCFAFFFCPPKKKLNDSMDHHYITPNFFYGFLRKNTLFKKINLQKDTISLHEKTSYKKKIYDVFV